MAYVLKSLINIPKLNRLFNILFKQTGISSALISLDGKILASTEWQDICGNFHAKNSDILGQCVLFSQNLYNSFSIEDKFACHQCPFGMTYIAVPVKVDGEHIANLLSSQFFLDKPDLEKIGEFRKLSLDFGFDEDAYLTALDRVPVIKKDKLNLIIDSNLFFVEILEKVVSSYLKEFEIRKEIKKAYGDIEAEIILRNAETDKLSQIIETNAIPTFVVNSDGLVTHWNKACELLTGYKVLEVTGTRTHQDVFYSSRRPLLVDLILAGAPHSEISDLYGDKVKKSSQNPDAYEGESFFLNLGDHGKHLFFTAAPLNDRGGRITGAICTLQDITDKRNAEHELKLSEERYRHLFESANDAIVLLKDGEIKDCNQKALFLFRCIRDELIGLSPLSFSPEFQPGGERSCSEISRKSEIVFQNVPLTFEWRFLRKDGSFFDAGVSISKTIISDQPYALSIIRDITGTKMLIETLKARESELDEKNSYLEKVNSALKASLDHREVERRALEENILSNMKKHVFPYIAELSRCQIGEHTRAYLNIIETNLNNLVSPYSNNIFSKYLDLTPTEIRVADLIRSGMNTKGIAEVLGLSPSSVQWHRKNIRIKFGLSGKKVNLHSYIVNLQR